MGLATRLGQRVKQLRTARKLTQARLAEAAGITPDQLSRIERGEKGARLGTIERLAEVLAVDPSTLFAVDIIDAEQPAAAEQLVWPAKPATSGLAPELETALQRCGDLLKNAARHYEARMSRQARKRPAR